MTRAFLRLRGPAVRQGLPILIAALAVLFTPRTGWCAFSFERTSSPVFYTDVGKSLQGMYAAYRVTTTTAVPDVWVKITGFAGGSVTAAPNEDGVFHVGGMTANSTRSVFFYLQAAVLTTTPQTHRLEVYDRNPLFAGAAQLATSAVFTITSVADTIAANANKVNTVVTGPTPATLGGIVTMTVTGESGTVGAAGIFAFSPAGYTSWPANKYELVGTTVTLPSGTVITDNLFVSGYTGVSGVHTETYRFVATGSTSAPTSVSPVGYISSGTQIKHTDTGGFASLTPIPPASNTLTMGLLANGASPADLTPAGGTVTYTVRVTNSGQNDATMDDFVQTLPSTPASPVYVGGSAAFNGVAIADPGISGQTLTWNGSYLIPAGVTRELSFRATIPGTSGNYQSSVVGHIGQEQIDTTQDTADNAPATSTVRVLARPTIAKGFSPASIAPGGTSRLTLVLGNANPVPLTGVTFLDNLPVSPGAMRIAAVPNAANGCGGTLSAVAGADNVRLSGASLGDNTTCTVAVDVTATVAGSYSNTAGGIVSAETGDTGDPSNAATLQVVLNPTVALSISPSGNPLSGDSLLTVALSNPDPDVALHGAAFTFAFPEGVVGTATPAASTTCDGGIATAAAGGGVIALSGATIPPADNCSVSVRIRSGTAGDYALLFPAGGLSTTEGRSNLDSAAATLHVLLPPTAVMAFTPSSVGTNGTSRLTVTLSNANTVDVTGVAFTADYPTGLVNGAAPAASSDCPSATVSATPGGNGFAFSGASIVAGGSCEVGVDVTSASAGSYAAGIPSITTGNAGNAAADNATLAVTAGVGLGGSAYADSDHNGSRDFGEAGTGSPVWVKLAVFGGAACAGPAVQVASVDPASGNFGFTGVADGNYCVTLSSNDLPGDVTPTLPAGWLSTDGSDGRREAVVSGGALSGLDFGLYEGIRIAGSAFADSGTGGGIANDGVRQGGEAGVSGASVKATDAGGSVLYADGRTDGGGGYVLWVPASSGAVVVKVSESRSGGTVATGGSAGTTGGIYDRASSSVTFSLSQGSVYSGVNFGGVEQGQFLTDGSRSALPGSVVFFPHKFVAGTAGMLALSTAAVPSPSVAGWSETLIRDTNCSGAPDAGEPALAGPFPVAAGESVCIVMKEFVPSGAPFNALNSVRLTAQLAFANALPPLTSTATRTDVTTVGQPAGAGLSISKSVDRATVLPGQTLTYTIVWTNQGESPLSNIVIHDSTPAFTMFVSAACVEPLPADITGCSVTAQPVPGGSGAIEWALSGTLAPGKEGAVSFTLQVAN